MSISLALTAVYETSKLRREKVLNLSDRVERQVKSFGQQLVPHHCDQTYLAEDIWCRQQFNQVFNQLIKNTWLCIIVGVPSTGPLLLMYSGMSRPSADVNKKNAEKSIWQTVFILITGHSSYTRRFICKGAAKMQISVRFTLIVVVAVGKFIFYRSTLRY